jgi:hypothetical protein
VTESRTDALSFATSCCVSSHWPIPAFEELSELEHGEYHKGGLWGAARTSGGKSLSSIQGKMEGRTSSPQEASLWGAAGTTGWARALMAAPAHTLGMDKAVGRVEVEGGWRP